MQVRLPSPIESIFVYRPLGLSSYHTSAKSNVKITEELKACLAGIPLDESHLDLKGVELFFENAAWTEIFMSSIPAQVTHLSLDIQMLIATQSFLTNLPILWDSCPNLHAVVVGGEFFVNKLLIDAEKAIKCVENDFKNDTLRFNVNNSIRQFMNDLDREKLPTLIDRLEKLKTPRAYLTCALLLSEGSIDNLTSVPATSTNNELKLEYEKRTHDVINFLNEAAKDKYLSGLIDTFLFHLQTVTPYSSVKERLAIFTFNAIEGACFPKNSPNQMPAVPPILKSGLPFFARLHECNKSETETPEQSTASIARLAK